MPSALPLALLACALVDSLPYLPLLEVDGPRVAYTVAEYMDTTVLAWRYAGEVVEVVEDPSAGQVLVLVVPLAGEGQGTGVETLPPNGPVEGASGPVTRGACGRLFSIDPRWWR
jgi:hypothetical protein